MPPPLNPHTLPAFALPLALPSSAANDRINNSLTSRSTPVCHFVPKASASDSSADQTFFLPIQDKHLLNSVLPSHSLTQKSPAALSPIAQIRTKQNRREFPRGPAQRTSHDEEEARRHAIIDERITEQDLLGIVDGLDNVPAEQRATTAAPAVPNDSGVERQSVRHGAGRKVSVGQRTKHTETAKNQTKERAFVDGALRSNEHSRSVAPEESRQHARIIRQGDLVLHKRHGVGRFRGVERTVTQGYRSHSPAHGVPQSERPVQEFAVIEYRDGDVYVPFSHFEVIRRLLPEECKQVQRLDTISGSASYADSSNGGPNARRAKFHARVKTREKIRKQLVNLHGLYAERTSLTRDPFPSHGEVESAFAESCEFELTDDQHIALAQVFRDMSERQNPMDRLLCGDVGFGKTEVAIRAAFRAVCAGKQVAILAPTTILAQQHYETICERFQSAGVNVTTQCLTRFVARKKSKETKEGVSRGEVDVVVGTHTLLSDTFRFKQLGLLIVDEEHRFGVNQKEKIRTRYRGVDTLFLSATPIPRTLHLALSGLRDASVLKTPPPGRKPVITKVSRIGAGVLREAIGFEMERGGQVFYVVPRIEGIEASANWIRDLFPELRVLVAHGQMNDLEHRIWAFAQRKYQLLVCTTIIENGINMPDVNTVIVQDAAKFGLAQLHQLRGRVGRCTIQAYAWMLYSAQGAMQSNAIDRLKTLEKFSALGSGFAIAQRDMEMRGIGTVLGVEQHGNTAVDSEEYARMLAEELEYARTGKPIPISLPDPATSIEIFLPVASLIPSEYIEDFEQKMRAYSSLSSAKTHDELVHVVRGLIRTYGTLPPSTKRHINILELKILAKALGISRIVTERQHVLMDWPIGEAAFNRLLAFLPEKQDRSRCEQVASEERVVVRGLGICSGDIQLVKLRSYLGCFRKAAAGLLEQRRVSTRADNGNLADSLSEID